MNKNNLITGGCSCGQLTFEINKEPSGIAACHCIACKKRTGSAFGIGCIFPLESVKVLGEYGCYKRIADSERWVEHQFCTHCGNTVMWTAQAMKNSIAIAGGAIDDPSWVQPRIHAWTSKSLSWVKVPDGVTAFSQAPIRK